MRESASADSWQSIAFSSLRGVANAEAIHKLKKIDCFDFLRKSRNDAVGEEVFTLRADFICLDCHAEPLARLAMTNLPSRHCEAIQQIAEAIQIYRYYLSGFKSKNTTMRLFNFDF